MIEENLSIHQAQLAAWRLLTPADQIGQLNQARPVIDPVLRDVVNACPDRGPELPVSAYVDGACCGGGPTRWECRRGLGNRPGQVTLGECLACIEEAFDASRS